MIAARPTGAVCLALIAAAFIPGAACASPPDVVQASRARIQVQRLAKLHLQLRAGIEPERARQELTRGLAGVDAAFKRLAGTVPNGRGRRIAERANAKWEAYRDLIRSMPQDGSVIHLDSEDLDNTLSALVQAVDGDGAGLAPFVALSLRQAMLSQRIAKLYLLRSLGDRSRGIEVDIAQTRLEFRGALNELVRAPENTDAIRAELELARVQWIFFDDALEDGSSKSPAFRRNVATTSERITQVMDEVVSRLLP